MHSVIPRCIARLEVRSDLKRTPPETKRLCFPKPHYYLRPRKIDMRRCTMQCIQSFPDASPGLKFVPLRTASAMQRYSTLTLLLLLLTACLLCSTVSRAEETLATAPAVTITPTVGPPTTNVLVWGTGFDPYAAVDIYFDTTDLALATTNGAGAFGGNCATCGIAIEVPTGAVPGTHWITAVERYGQKAAQKSFLVQTDWAQFRFSPNHKGVNPYENVLRRSQVRD